MAGSAHTVEPGATVARVEGGRVASAPSSPIIAGGDSRNTSSSGRSSTTSPWVSRYIAFAGSPTLNSGTESSTINRVNSPPSSASASSLNPRNSGIVRRSDPLGAIGRSTFPCELNKFPYDPRTNRARGFPAHGFREGSRLATRHSLRILHGAAQTVEAGVWEKFSRPLPRPARRQLAPRSLDAQAAEPLVDVRVDLSEVASGVPRAEVAPPSTEDRVEAGDHHAEIRVTSSP